jgi:hypothetical protein
VEEDDGREGALALGPVDPRPELPLGAGDGAVLGACHGDELLRGPGAVGELQVQGAPRLGAPLVHGRQARLFHHGEHRCDVRVDRHGDLLTSRQREWTAGRDGVRRWIAGPAQL